MNYLRGIFGPSQNTYTIPSGPSSSSQPGTSTQPPEPELPKIRQHEKTELQERLGWIPTKIAVRIGSAIDEKVEQPIKDGMTSLASALMPSQQTFQFDTLNFLRIGASLLTLAAADPVAKLSNKAFKNLVIDAEVSSLQIADRAQTILTRTSAQELSETLHILTDFLTTYKTAFATLSTRQFASREEEDAAWQEQMGNSWHPIINPANQTPEQKQQAFAQYVQDIVNRIETIILADNRHIAPAIPGAQEYGVQRLNRKINEIVAENAASSQNFLSELSDRKNAYRSIRHSLNEVIASLRDLSYPIPLNHDVLFENNAGKDVVFSCSERAQEMGITIGMNVSEAEQIWNSQKRANEPKFEDLFKQTNPRQNHILLDKDSHHLVVAACSERAREAGITLGMDKKTACNLWKWAYPESRVQFRENIAATTPPNHHILAENVTQTRQIVFYCSSRASELGVRPGMDIAQAVELWNAKKNDNEPVAIVVDEEAITATNIIGPLPEGIEPLSFKGHLPLRAQLESVITAVLSSSPGIAREIACETVSSIPVFGRILSGLVRAIFWMTSVGIRGANYFIGIPSAEVLAREITGNLLRHLYNPAALSAPLLVVERILNILEGNETEGRRSDATNREPFLGELTLALAALLPSLCPSLFNLTYPRWAIACVNVAFWMARKSISVGGLMLTNPLTIRITLYAIGRFSAPENKIKNRMLAKRAITWIRTSLRALKNSRHHLQTTHFILDSGYRTLGELGLVSREQSHFARGNQSLAQLIHQTIIAGARILMTKEFHPNSFDDKMSYRVLLKKLKRQEMPSQVQIEQLRENIAQKLMPIYEERGRAAEKIQLIQSLPNLTENGFAWLADNNEINTNLNQALNAWIALEDNIALDIAHAENTRGIANLELIEILRRVRGVKNTLEKLKNSAGTRSFLTDTIQDLVIAISEQNQLRFELETIFQSQQGALNTQIESLNDEFVNMDTIDGLRAHIQRLINENEIATFVEPRLAEEARLMEEIRLLDEAIIDSKGEEAQAVLAFLTQDAKSQTLSGEREIFITSNPTFRQFSELQLQEQINLYLPGELRSFRREQAELTARKMELRKKIDRLPEKPLFTDPAWVLQQNGEELVETAKRTVSWESLEEHVNTLTNSLR